MAYKQFSPLPVLEGGTNSTTFTHDHGVLVFEAGQQITVNPGTSNQVLASNGALLPPTFQDISSTGAITTVNGNTGSVTPTTGAITISGSGPLSSAGSGSTLSLTTTAANVFHSGSGDATASSNAITITGSGGISTSATGSTLTIDGSGITGGIVTLDGDTGSATGSTVTLAGSGVVSTSATSATVTFASSAANVIHSSSGDATASSNAFTVVGAGGITTSATGSTVTITGGASGFSWNNTTGATQAMSVDNGYVSNDGVTLVTFTLPATAAVGKVVAVQGSGAGLFTIAQNSGQTIHFNGGDSTTGVTGTVSSSGRYDAITLICITADTDWAVNQSVGNFNVV